MSHRGPAYLRARGSDQDSRWSGGITRTSQQLAGGTVEGTRPEAAKTGHSGSRFLNPKSKIANPKSGEDPDSPPPRFCRMHGGLR
jgi:hypothetical protein